MAKFSMAILVLILISVPVLANYGTYNYFIVDPNRGYNLQVPIGVTPYLSMACDSIYRNAWACVRSAGGIDYIVKGGEDSAGQVNLRQIYPDNNEVKYRAIIPRSGHPGQYVATGSIDTSGWTNVFYWNANMDPCEIPADEAVSYVLYNL